MSTMGVPGQKCVTSGIHCGGRGWALGLGVDSWPLAPEAGWLGDRPHLDGDIVKAGGVHDIIADEHEVGVLVGQGPQSVIVFLP